MTDKAILDALAKELAALDGQEVVIGCAPSDCLALIGQLQLALRHPRNKGVAATVAEAYIGRAAQWFDSRGCVAVLDVIRRGFEVAHDE